MADLLSTMNDLKAVIEKEGAATLRQNASPQEIHEFGDRLEQFEPFKTISRKFLSFPMGGGRTGRGVSGRWVYFRMLDGIEPQVLIDQAQATLAANRYEAREIRAVRGIEISEVHALLDTLSLVPSGALTHSWCHEQAFPRGMQGSFCTENTAALVHAIVVEPAFRDGTDEEHEKAFEAFRNKRAKDAARVRLALGLASGGPVQMPFRYSEVENSSLFREAMSVFSQDGNAHFWGVDREVNIEEVRSFLAEFEKMDSPLALELSIDRLLRSRVFGELENRIIDLGMAAEIALMHSKRGVSDGKSEITNKMANRGAWLIGSTPDERVEVVKQLSDLYSARSVVVHTGEAKAALLPRVADFDRIVAQIVIALLKRGAFPDWKRLVLGG
ncbi:HEPN domain-containing protein [Novosphingobium rosa]|uniref:HEPN domain-containing protein n=1 Tax=Novosphingobium rosa TaxID=76978 RepID=UPI00082C1978|nr:HEPN domain-containing protein [Novosphingobium rosa]